VHDPVHTISSIPDAGYLEAYGARHVGELFRTSDTGGSLADVAAYLCGNGPAYTCEVTDYLNDMVIGAPSTSPSASSIKPAISGPLAITS
jgi:hypothetical protein